MRTDLSQVSLRTYRDRTFAFQAIVVAHMNNFYHSPHSTTSETFVSLPNSEQSDYFRVRDWETGITQLVGQCMQTSTGSSSLSNWQCLVLWDWGRWSMNKWVFKRCVTPQEGASQSPCPCAHRSTLLASEAPRSILMRKTSGFPTACETIATKPMTELELSVPISSAQRDK